MPRARRARLTLALIIGSLATACDDDAGEVDRGAKPIEAQRSDDGPTDLASLAEVDDVELADVMVVATGTLGNTPLAVLADAERTIVAAAIREGGQLRWLDVDALTDGELVRLAARPADLDPNAAELLQQLAHGLPDAESPSEAEALAQPGDPTPVQCPPPLGAGRRGVGLEPNC